jgi:hypothetical protein
VFQDQPKQKVSETHLNKKAECVVVHNCNPSLLGVIGRKIKDLGQPWQKQETLSEKYLKQKGLEE